jgi:hypothetical protein
MPPEQAQALMQFLQTNPDAARQAYQQAQAMMKSPSMAKAFLNLQVGGGAAQVGSARRTQLQSRGLHRRPCPPGPATWPSILPPAGPPAPLRRTTGPGPHPAPRAAPPPRRPTPARSTRSSLAR